MKKIKRYIPYCVKSGLFCIKNSFIPAADCNLLRFGSYKIHLYNGLKIGTEYNRPLKKYSLQCLMRSLIIHSLSDILTLNTFGYTSSLLNAFLKYWLINRAIFVRPFKMAQKKLKRQQNGIHIYFRRKFLIVRLSEVLSREF